ncbi:PAS domain S-box-containing protein [Halobacillus dabanensis]|uniref:Oxygen sensor histidine kinase NreB n=1 Tax=Halobacillus dabanensis TaxID=240302 RepID=A0A1I4AFA2_HALDA|nr:PAS domain S-box protein [Halobacillus dabanensis]SFK54456.1 PAS domain S-box-containing protein [Halobacillus dabanensis]
MKDNQSIPVVSPRQEGFLIVREDGIITSLNEKAQDLFQWKGGEVEVGNLFLHMSLEDLHKCEKGVLLQHYINPEGRNPYPVFMVVHTARTNGALYFYISIHNLVERSLMDRQVYEPLKELLDTKYALDESSIVAVTDQRGTIRYVNKKFSEISKYEVDELIGQDHRILNSGYHSKAFFKELWRTIGTGNVWKGEVRNRAKDGTYYWVDTTIVPFLNEKGKPYQYLAIRNEITERKRVEAELQHMMTRLINVQENERKHVSRELHDGVGQELYSLLISMHRLEKEFGHPLIQQMTADISGLIQNVRDMSWELRPSALDELGLIPAVRSFLNRLGTSYGLKVDFHTEVRCRLAPEVETSIYRIIQEALTNVRKYSGVKRARVSISEENQRELLVCIEDGGAGFSPDEYRNGVGLFSMEERARSIGGFLQIHSSYGQGTKIELAIPLEA